VSGTVSSAAVGPNSAARPSSFGTSNPYRSAAVVVNTWSSSAGVQSENDRRISSRENGVLPSWWG
jgi:hypothetical protein